METNDSAAEKRTGTAVKHLNFGKKTALRVSWEMWSFRIAGPHQVEVCNESYGYLKDDHKYTVGVEVRDGLAVPAECDCPADLFGDDYDCKHKVALATVGGPTVLNAAVNYESSTKETPSDLETMADKLRADGGDRDQQEANEKCGCTSDFPCADCFINGKREFSE
jgi:hypothetical protein